MSIEAIFGGHAVQQARSERAVQRKVATGHAAPTGQPPSAPDTRAAAARGLDTPSTSLPHAAAIQRSFGADHDVSQVQAHIGGAAAEACDDMGGSAFAAGTHVAFAGPPDLHTAAHEAAHVVQQARGVNLYDGVGEAGDVYERHADAVADRVIAGASAADLLSSGPSSTGHASSHGVQRQAPPAVVQRDGSPAPAPGASPPNPAPPKSAGAGGVFKPNDLARTRFKTDLMDKVNDGIKPDPVKVADLPKGCIVKILESSFNNLAYRVVVTGFDADSAGVKGTQGIVSKDFIEAGVEPKSATLDDDVRIARFVAAAKAKQAAIAAMKTTDERRDAYGALANQCLTDIGVPPCKLTTLSSADGNGGEFTSKDWSLAISPRLGQLDIGDDGNAKRAAANFYHEARHAEQSYRIVQYLAGLEPDPAKKKKFVSDMTGGDILDSVIDHGIAVPLPPQYAAQAKEWFNSEYGNAAARAAILENLKTSKGDDDAYKAYRNLPEEKDAHGVGGKVAEQYAAAK